MSDNTRPAQQEELEALQSIYLGDEFQVHRVMVSDDLRATFWAHIPLAEPLQVKYKETLDSTEYSYFSVSHIPPIELQLTLPEQYPTKECPQFVILCQWLTVPKLKQLCKKLRLLWNENESTEIIFTWCNFLQNETLQFLNCEHELDLSWIYKAYLKEKKRYGGHRKSKHNVPDKEEASGNTFELETESKTKKVSGTHQSDYTRRVRNKQRRIDDVKKSMANEKKHAKNIQLVEKLRSTEFNERNRSLSNNKHCMKVVQMADGGNNNQTFSESISHGVSSNSRKRFTTKGWQSDKDYNSQRKPIVAESAGCKNKAEDKKSSKGVVKEDARSYTDEDKKSKCLTSAGKSNTERKCGAMRYPKYKDYHLNMSKKVSPVDYLKSYSEERGKIEFLRECFTCIICFMDKLGKDCLKFKGCDHVFCKDCMKNYFSVKISEGTVQTILCPQEKCISEAFPSQVKDVVDEEVFAKYDQMLLNAALDTLTDIVYCPRTFCQYPVTWDPEEKMANCPACHYAFCVYCKTVYHGIEPCKFRSEERQKLVEKYQSGDAQVKTQMELRYGKRNLEGLVNASMSEAWIKDNSKACPHCSAAIEKSDGCNKMVCWKCNAFFCWLCSQELDRDDPYLHYQNPASRCNNKLFLVPLDEEEDWEGWDWVDVSEDSGESDMDRDTDSDAYD